MINFFELINGLFQKELSSLDKLIIVIVAHIVISILKRFTLFEGIAHQRTCHPVHAPFCIISLVILVDSMDQTASLLIVGKTKTLGTVRPLKIFFSTLQTLVNIVVV